MNGNGTGVDVDVKKYPMISVKKRNDNSSTITNARNRRNNKRLRISLTDECILSLKFIPNTVHSEDQFIRLQLMAQVADVRIDGALIAFKGDAVYGIQ